MITAVIKKSQYLKGTAILLADPKVLAEIMSAIKGKIKPTQAIGTLTAGAPPSFSEKDVQGSGIEVIFLNVPRNPCKTIFHTVDCGNGKELLVRAVIVE